MEDKFSSSPFFCLEKSGCSRLTEDCLFIILRANGNSFSKEKFPSLTIDNGELLKKLFKRFSQGTSQKRSAGTGLGLYLSRQIVEAHNGRIWAESVVSKGSVFSFMLPQALNVKEKV